MSRQRESYPLSSDSAEKLKQVSMVCFGPECRRLAKGRPMYEGRFADRGRGPEPWQTILISAALAQGMLECQQTLLVGYLRSMAANNGSYLFWVGRVLGVTRGSAV